MPIAKIQDDTNAPGLFSQFSDWTSRTSLSLVRNHPLKTQIASAAAGAVVAKHGASVVRKGASKISGLFGGATRSAATVAAESTGETAAKGLFGGLVKSVL